MKPTAYYNEHDPNAAAWLRVLISEGHIAPGIVDETSIEDVRPADLVGFTQCHFFAGIGVWSYALRLAGWADDRPVWTGSCPCQPFSAAGKGGGFDDERHLWPHFHWLISQCRPDVVLGEQVASKDGLAWLDLVQADLEGTGYAAGAVDLCAAGVGAPHIRQRLWWVAQRLAHADGRQLAGQPIIRGVERDGQNARRPEGSGSAPACRDHGGLADGLSLGRQGLFGEGGPGLDRGPHHERTQSGPRLGVEDGRMADAADIGRDGRRTSETSVKPGSVERSARLRAASAGPAATSPTNGLWRDADWLFCRDGKWRPVEPGTFPLAARVADELGRGKSTLGGMARSNRVIRLKGYGNGINGEVATGFIRAVMQGQQ